MTDRAGSYASTAEGSLPPLAPPDAPAEERDRAIVGRWMARAGRYPTLGHYRRVYESVGAPWPGDEEVRRLYHVAPDASSPAA